ncbi:MAG: hypothetical protein ACFCUV_11570 [Rivularia sp. (in: cyanobacteria)]
MTEQEYQLQAEKITGDIRSEKIKQLKHDRDAEKERTTQALQQVSTEKQKTLIAQENTKIESLKVLGRRTDAVLLRHANNRKNIDASHQAKENPLYQKTLDLKYQNLETGYLEAQKMLQNRRELLKQQGLLG